MKLSTADDSGQYITVIPPSTMFDSGYPYVARTNSLIITLTPAEQQQVDASAKRREAAKT